MKDKDSTKEQKMALEKQTIKEAGENLKKPPITNALRSNKNTIYLKHEYSVIKVKQQSTRMGYQNEKKKNKSQNNFNRWVGK